MRAHHFGVLYTRFDKEQIVISLCPLEGQEGILQKQAWLVSLVYEYCLIRWLKK